MGLAEAEQELDKVVAIAGDALGGALDAPVRSMLVEALAELASVWLDDARRTEDLSQALKWARCTLHFDPKHARAQFLEARAIDLLDARTQTERLGLAIANLKVFARDAASPFCTEAKQMLYEGTAAEFVPPQSLPGRYRQRLNVLFANEALAIERKGGSPIKEMKGLTLKGLGLTGNDSDVSVQEALEQLRSGQGKGIHQAKAERLLKFLLLVDDEPEINSAACLDSHIAFRRRGQCLSVLSWNSKLLNVFDQKDEDFVAASCEKACNIGERSMAADVMAELVCIQEAPGPQLLARGGPGARRAVQENTFPNALRETMQARSDSLSAGAQHFETACVAVHCYDHEGADQGEMHVFCYDSKSLVLEGEPKELTVNEVDKVAGARFHRAPAWSKFRVQKAGSLRGACLIAVTVHLKSGGGEEVRQRFKPARCNTTVK